MTLIHSFNENRMGRNTEIMTRKDYRLMSVKRIRRVNTKIFLPNGLYGCSFNYNSKDLLIFGENRS